MSAGRKSTILLFVGFVGFGCADSVEEQTALARDVLLVTLDTTRADRLGAYGYAKAKTPVLDELARRGLLYERAYATTPITLPSHASVLTGLYPCAHGVRDNGLFALGAAADSLPEVLAERGYRTGAFLGSYVLDERFGLGQGFETYRGPKPARLGMTPEVVERKAEAVVDDALSWLNSLPKDEPFFAWVHFYDAHAAYQPPERFQFEDPYDGEIAYCDEQLGRLLDGLAMAGRDDELLVVVTADHGESLGDHAEKTHGVFLYESTLRVPLVVALPGEHAPRDRRPELVSIAQIPATILDAVAMSKSALPEALGGLAGIRSQSPAKTEAIYLESQLPYHSYGWHPLAALVEGDTKLVEAPEPELYNLARDPRELHNLAQEDPDTLDRMQTLLQEFRGEHPDLGLVERRTLGEEERSRLQAMGYLSVDSDIPVEEVELPDPKERIGDLILRDQALKSLQRGRALLGQDAALGGQAASVSPAQRAEGNRALAEARQKCLEVIEANPRDGFTQGLLGLIEISRADFAAAIAPLEASLLVDPRAPQSHYNLAVSYQNTGRLDAARRQMQKAVTVEPRFQVGCRWLMQFHGERGELTRAVWWAKRLEECLEDPRQRESAARFRVAQEEILRARGLQPEAPPDYPATEFGPSRKD